MAPFEKAYMIVGFACLIVWDLAMTGGIAIVLFDHVQPNSLTPAIIFVYVMFIGATVGFYKRIWKKL